MSPNGKPGAQKPTPLNNLYTAILAMACGVVLATAAFVLYMCYVQYERILP